MKHLQKNGHPGRTACGLPVRKKRVDHTPGASLQLSPDAVTWNLSEVSCGGCKRSRQYRDSQAYGDSGSAGREV